MPTGSLEAGVRFEFRENAAEEKSTFEIRRFAVLAVDMETERVVDPIWTLRGSASVDEIEYRFAPDGLAELNPAATLISGRIYYVMAEDWKRGGGGLGETFFAVTQSGTVRACTGPDCAAIAAET